MRHEGHLTKGDEMSYWNRDRTPGEPLRLYCDSCLPVRRPPAWEAITCRRSNPPTSLSEYMAQTFPDGLSDCYDGTAEEQNEFADLMARPVTPDGWAWDRRYGLETVCDGCGRPA